MATQVIQQETVSSKLISHWEQVCQKVATLAQEIPSGKFDYKAAKELRSFGDVLRHIAFWNQYAADSALGKNPDVAANEIPKEKFSSKKQVIDAVKHSAAKAADAFKKAQLTPELAETIASFIEHNCEHYGQLVVYARLNGIVPPASRG
jgi:uncharacterized damage-inducible protein DinB